MKKIKLKRKVNKVKKKIKQLVSSKRTGRKETSLKKYL